MSNESNQIKTFHVFYRIKGQPILRLEEVIGTPLAVEGWARGKGVTVVEMLEAPPLFPLVGLLPAPQGKGNVSV
jgi:hypothetical protein